jgi:hypothetical protein
VSKNGSKIGNRRVGECRLLRRFVSFVVVHHVGTQTGHLDLISLAKDEERRMTPADNIMDAKKKWPLIWKDGKNCTDEFCRFVVVLKRGTPAAAVAKFRSVMK